MARAVSRKASSWNKAVKAAFSKGAKNLKAAVKVAKKTYKKKSVSKSRKSSRKSSTRKSTKHCPKGSHGRKGHMRQGKMVKAVCVKN